MSSGRTSTTKGIQDPRYRELITRLIDARKASALSQETLATLLNRHQQFVSRYETGERRLDVVEFVDIARALKCDIGPMVADIAYRK